MKKAAVQGLQRLWAAAFVIGILAVTPRTTGSLARLP